MSGVTGSEGGKEMRRNAFSAVCAASAGMTAESEDRNHAFKNSLAL